MRVALIGRSEFLFKTAKHLLGKGFEIPLIITSKESPEYKYTSDDFRRLASDNYSHFLYSPKIDVNELSEIVEKVSPVDIAVSVNYPNIIQEDVINCFKHGILNAHAGDLPKYRGNACVAWAMLNNEDKIGLCVHKMRGGELDSGDIMSRNYFNINIDTRIKEVFDWMESEIPILFESAINKLSNNSNYYLEKQIDREDESLRCYPRIPSDGLINWSKSRQEILRLINSSSEPYSGAYTYLNGKKVIVWRAKLKNDSDNYLGVNGQIASILDDMSVDILTSNGKINISEIEIDGNRTKPGSIINSIRNRFGKKS